MSIEFRCTQCNKLLRTGDETAGKQAQCPQCGAVMTIPAASAAGSGVPSSQPPLPPGETPFSAAGAPAAGSTEPGSPFQPPAAAGYMPPAAITPSPLDLGVFGRTWAVMKPNWGLCLAVIVIVVLISFGVEILIGIPTHVIAMLAMNPFVMIAMGILEHVVTMAINFWLGIGQSLYFLKLAKGQQPPISEIFAGGPYFWRVLLATILLMLIILGIILACGAPALISLAISQGAAILLAILGGFVYIILATCVTLMFSQFYFLILDRDAGAVESLATSKKLMEGNKLMLLVVEVLLLLIALAILAPCLICVVLAFVCVANQAVGAAVFLGFLAAILGFSAVLVGLPYVVLLRPVIYLTITGQPTADQRRVGAVN